MGDSLRFERAVVFCAYCSEGRKEAGAPFEKEFALAGRCGFALLQRWAGEGSTECVLVFRFPFCQLVGPALVLVDFSSGATSVRLKTHENEQKKQKQINKNAKWRKHWIEKTSKILKDLKDQKKDMKNEK